MPRKVPRQTLARGIYRDGHRLELRVTLNGITDIAHLPGDTELDDAKRYRARMLARAQTAHPRPKALTLAADIVAYLKLQTHQVSYRNKKAMLAHWSDRLGHLPRHRITAQAVAAMRIVWLDKGIKPKTINHRVAILRHLYATLDGKHAPTPCDEIAPLPVPRTPIRRVSETTILTVDQRLQALEQDAEKPGRKFDGAKTRARFRVLVTTGRRPSEVMRAEPSDVDLEQRVWVVRDGKGGWSPGIFLNADMLAAWRLFIAADAWGKFNLSSFGDTLRRAGWPKDVRLYNLRHTTLIEAIERGGDMADVQTLAGHKSIATTRIYTGVRHSRMQQISERLEGRFSGFPEVPKKIPDAK